MSTEYKTEQDIRNRIRIQEVLKELPSYCGSFARYMLETKGSSTMTVLGYMHDLETFFYYMLHNNPQVSSPKAVTIEMLEGLTPMDIEEYMSFITVYEKDGKRYTNSPVAKARKLSCLKMFWKYANNMDILKNNPTLVIPTPKVGEKEIVKLEKSEVKDFLKGVETGDSLTVGQRKNSQKLALRDMAILSLMLGTGIRVSECVGINLSDLDFKQNSVKILRKGNKESTVYFDETVAENIKNYIELERIQPDVGGDENALFISRKRRRISVRAVELLVRKYASIFPYKKITPHKLRSTFATELYRESGDIYLTADSLGHSSPNVTAKRYADLGNQRRKMAPEYIRSFFQNENE